MSHDCGDPNCQLNDTDNDVHAFIKAWNEACKNAYSKTEKPLFSKGFSKYIDNAKIVCDAKSEYEYVYNRYIEILTSRKAMSSFKQTNVSIADLRDRLSVHTKSNADKISKKFISIAPGNNYDNLLDNPKTISHWLSKEGYKKSNWFLTKVAPSSIKGLFNFEFTNHAVGFDDTCLGIVYVSEGGIVKHISVGVK